MQMAGRFMFVLVHFLLTLGILKIDRAGRRNKRQDHRRSRICQTPELVEAPGWEGLRLCGGQVPDSHAAGHRQPERLVSGPGAAWVAGWVDMLVLSLCFNRGKKRENAIRHKSRTSLSCCNILK